MLESLRFLFTLKYHVLNVFCYSRLNAPQVWHVTPAAPHHPEHQAPHETRFLDLAAEQVLDRIPAQNWNQSLDLHQILDLKLETRKIKIQTSGRILNLCLSSVAVLLLFELLQPGFPCENEHSQSRSGIDNSVKNGVLGVIPVFTICG